jgi:hypothetical protein
MEKPLLLLDIDGALSPMVGRGESGEDLLWVTGIEGVDKRLPQWLEELGAIFTLVWASSWEGEANSIFGPGLGLSELAFVHFDRMGEATWKLRSVLEYVGVRRFAWVDDDIYGDALIAVRDHPGGALLVKTAPRRGITQDNVDALLAFGVGSSSGGEMVS